MVFKLMSLPWIVLKQIVTMMDPVTIFCMLPTSSKVFQVVNPIIKVGFGNMYVISVSVENVVRINLNDHRGNNVARIVAQSWRGAELHHHESTWGTLNIRWHPEVEDLPCIYVHCANTIFGAQWAVAVFMKSFWIPVKKFILNVPGDVDDSRLVRLTAFVNDTCPEECVWKAQNLTTLQYFDVLQNVNIKGSFVLQLDPLGAFDLNRLRDRKDPVSIIAERITLENPWWLDFRQLMGLVACSRITFSDLDPFPARNVSAFISQYRIGSHPKLELLRIGRVEFAPVLSILRGHEAQLISQEQKIYRITMIDRRTFTIQFVQHRDEGGPLWEVTLQRED